MSRSTHHIRSHTLDLHYHGDADGARLRSAAEQWQRTVWMPLLERVLDELAPDAQTLMLDRLEVDVDDLTPSHWQDGTGSAALQKLEETVRQKLLDSLGHTLPADHRALDAAIHYLRTGALPWWCPADLRADPGAWLRQWMMDSPEASLAEASSTLLSSAAARTRLAAEVYDEPFWKLVRAIATGSDAAVWRKAYADCEALLCSAGMAAGSFCISCRAAVLAAALHMRRRGGAGPDLTSELAPLLNPDTRRLLQPSLDRLAGLGATSRAGEMPAEESGKTKEILTRAQRANDAMRLRNGDPEDGQDALPRNKVPASNDARPDGISEIDSPGALDGVLDTDALLFSDFMLDEETREAEMHYYIAGAGAVLLAPFLPQLFSRLGWVEGKTLTQAAKASVLMHYVTWGRDSYHEWELLLPKLLCGLPHAALVPRGTVELPADERGAADEMLRSAISHWAVLKATSPDGLRDAFLQREGRLTEKEGAWRLLVQPAAHDVLLQHLPWSFGIVRLPWMEGPLYVDWE